jgi:hypothetical protein
VVPATAPVNVTVAVALPLHTVWLVTADTVGVGFIVMVKICDGPLHVNADGVTVNVPAIGVVPLLVPVNAGMFPVPDEAIPIEELLLFQVYVVPATELLNVSAAVGALLHTAWLKPPLPIGVGFTVIVNVCATPGQLLADGVTDITAVAATVDELVAVKEAILPVPVDASPMLVLLLVQV